MAERNSSESVPHMPFGVETPQARYDLRVRGARPRDIDVRAGIDEDFGYLQNSSTVPKDLTGVAPGVVASGESCTDHNRDEEAQEGRLRNENGRPQGAHRNMDQVIHTANQRDGDYVALPREGDQDSEVEIMPRARNPLPARPQPRTPFHMTGAPLHLRPEPYDGVSDWLEYLVYFEQLAEVQGWDQPTMAIVLGLSLKGSARSVLVNLSLQERRDYSTLKDALTQNFRPPQQVHLYQVELRSRKRQAGESLAELGRDIIRLTRLAYPSADQATRETIGISAFLDAIPNPSLEIRLSVTKGHPRTVLEAVALAMEVDAILQADTYGRAKSRKDHTHQLDDDKPEAVTTAQLLKTIEKLEKEVMELKNSKKPPRDGHDSSKKSFTDRETRTCYNCGKVGHLARDCRKKPKNPGNGGSRPSSQ